MKLFACCITAYGAFGVVSAPAFCRARTKQEAVGWAIDLVKKDWPHPNYQCHQASATEIPLDFIKETLAIP